MLIGISISQLKFLYPLKTLVFPAFSPARFGPFPSFFLARRNEGNFFRPSLRPYPAALRKFAWPLWWRGRKCSLWYLHQMSQQLLHILGCGPVREKVGRICMPQQMEVKIIHRKIIADIICGSCCVNSCFFLVINPSVQYETKWVSERSVWMLRSDALLRYSFFYRGDNDYRNSSVSFCNAAPLLISDFFSAPLANQKKARYNMTIRTEAVIFSGRCDLGFYRLRD